MLTIDGCCDNINITSGTTIVMFGEHRYGITVVHCKSCGSQKSTSNIKHLKEADLEQSSQSVPRGKKRSAITS